MVWVVNHPQNVSEEIREESDDLATELEKISTDFPIALHVIRATQPGVKFGVGEARRIGMDFAAHELLNSPNDRIVSLDADTQVAENYIETLLTHPMAGAGFTLAYEHRPNESEDPRAISLYDQFLRYMAGGLRRAGSPFTFIPIGSAMGTDRKHYLLSGGIPKKSATEDFHFLNKLRKLGEIEYWPETTVYPSCRKSERVYLGTGYFLSEYSRNPQKAFARLHIPSPAAFEKLTTALSAMNEFFENPQLPEFVSEFEPALRELRGNCTSPGTFRKRLPQVFDGLATWRLLRQWSADLPHPTEDEFLGSCKGV